MKIKKVVALVLVCAMALTGLVACGKSPKETVLDSFATLVEGSSAKGFVKDLGITEIMNNMAKKPFTVGMKLTLDKTDVDDLEMLESGSIFAEVAYDEAAKKAMLDMGVGYGGSDIVSGQLYIDEKQLAVAVPELLDEVFYVEFDNIIKNFKKSALAEMIGMSDEDFEIIDEAFKALEKAGKDADADEMLKFFLGFNDEIKEFKDKIEVEEIDAEKFEINGKERKCNGYEVVITKKSIANLIEAAIDYYLLSADAKDFYENIAGQVEEAGGSVDMDSLYDTIEIIEENKDDVLDMVKECISDIEAEMYIYEGEIVSLDASVKITDPTGSFGVDSFKVGIALECTGGDYSVYDNYQLAVKVMNITLIKLEKESETKGDDYSAEWTVSSAALEDTTIGCSFAMDKKKGDFEASAVFNGGEMKMSASAEGNIKIEKKKSVKVAFDEIKIKYQDYWESFSIGLSGEYYAECEADISMPKGDKFNILTTETSDWEKLVDDIKDIEDILDVLEPVFSGGGKSEATPHIAY